MYEAYYHLTAKPFPLRPDPRFFFASSSHKRAMSYLQYGIEQGEGFIVITGDIGTGKTTLVQNLFNHLERDNLLAAQLVTTQLQSEDLLRMVAASFGLEYEGMSKAALLRQFGKFLEKNAWEGKRVLLVVDEVQNIPMESLEELRMLSNFQVANVSVLQTFLLGQKEFNATLNSRSMEQLRQRVIASYQLKSLNQEEVRHYIEHRLALAGWQDNPSFSSESFDMIHAYTAGVPRRINMFCDRILLYGYLEELNAIGQKVVQAVIDELKEEVAHQQEHEFQEEQSSGTRSPNHHLENRLSVVEERVAELEDALQLERARLRALTLNGK